MAFVTTADGEKGIKAVPYSLLKGDIRKVVKTLRTELADKDVLGSPPEEEEIKENDDTEVLSF